MTHLVSGVCVTGKDVLEENENALGLGPLPWGRTEAAAGWGQGKAGGGGDGQIPLKSFSLENGKWKESKDQPKEWDSLMSFF